MRFFFFFFLATKKSQVETELPYHLPGLAGGNFYLPFTNKDEHLGSLGSVQGSQDHCSGYRSSVPGLLPLHEHEPQPAHIGGPFPPPQSHSGVARVQHMPQDSGFHSSFNFWHLVIFLSFFRAWLCIDTLKITSYSYFQGFNDNSV